MEEQFLENWRTITRHYIETCGSFGSRLHRGSDGIYYGYAQWPDSQTKERAVPDVRMELARLHMKDAVTETFAEIHLEPVADHLVHSVTAIGEPEGQKRRAYADLDEALPSPAACAEIGATIHRIATTPDFHPGKPVPVGVVADVEGAVLPHMIGNDIGCGMRMIVIEGQGACEMPAALDGHLRHIYFQGGRDLALTGRNRHALLRDGLPGLFESFAGGRKGVLGKLDLAACWADPSYAEQLLGWRAELGLERMCADAWRWQSENPDGYPAAG